MGDVYKLTIAQRDGAGNYLANVLNWDVTGAGGGDPWSIADQIIMAWVGANQPAWLGATPQDSHIDYYSCKRVNGGGGPSAITFAGAVGLYNKNTFANGLATDIALIPAAGYNRVGHIYKAPLPTDALSAQAPQGTWIAAIAALIVSLGTAMALGGGGSAALCIYSRKTAIPHAIDHLEARYKPTAMNRRMLPII